jgi:hypothetical protein
MKITIKELRQLVKSVISENLRFDGSEYMYEDPDDETFVIDFELNDNVFEVEGKYYGGEDIEIDSILINGAIDGLDSKENERGYYVGMIQQDYSGMDYDEFKDYVIDYLNS